MGLAGVMIENQIRGSEDEVEDEERGCQTCEQQDSC